MSDEPEQQCASWREIGYSGLGGVSIRCQLRAGHDGDHESPDPADIDDTIRWPDGGETT